MWEQWALEYWEEQLGKKPQDDVFAFSKYVGCAESVYRIERGTYIAQFYKRGYNTIFFRSKLDSKIVRILIRVPDNYNPQRKYPFVPLLSVYSSDFYSARVKFADSVEDFLCADISGRGTTLGSYIGEASIQEVMDIICQLYSVDSARIYMSGYSSGAYGAWALSEQYPHRYAGAIIASGEPEKEMLHNLSNLPVYAFSSPNDTQACFESLIDAKEVLRRSKKHHCILAKK